MISRLRGEVVEHLADGLVIECAGVGYEVAATASARSECALGQNVTLLVRQIVREDGWYLFGFLQDEERRLFDQLRHVKGCGPKISLAVLDALGVAGAVAAIQTGDYKQLACANGVGMRLAERIAVDLREKVAAGFVPVSPSKVSPAVPQDSIVEALINLGYRRAEAVEAAEAVRHEHEDEASRLRAALRRLRSS